MNKNLVSLAFLSSLSLTGCEQSLNSDLKNVLYDSSTTTYFVGNDCAILSSTSPNFILDIRREKNRVSMSRGVRDWDLSFYTYNSEKFLALSDNSKTSGKNFLSDSQLNYLTDNGGLVVGTSPCSLVFPSNHNVNLPLLETTVKQIFSENNLEFNKQISSSLGPLEVPFFYGYKKQ